jgi:hypothetical protein
MGAHDTPKTYLDNGFTWERRDENGNLLEGRRVLKSVYSGSTYYAAIEAYDGTGQRRSVTAAVCLVRWNPGARSGEEFGYKDMDEDMGPAEAAAPRSILELLTSTDVPYALNWRRRCYRRLQLVERKLPDGALIRLAQPLRFTDGSKESEFRVRKEGRKLRLTRPDGNGRYQISRLMERAFEIIPEPKVTKTLFPA